MSNPDILELTSMYGAISFEASITTTNTFVLSNVLDSNQVYKINDITVTNVDGTTATTVSVFIDRPSTTAHLARTISVPADTTLTVVSKENSIYLEEGDAIVAVAGANDILSVNISYEIIGTSASFVTTDLAVHLDANDVNSYDNRLNSLQYSTSIGTSPWTLINGGGVSISINNSSGPFTGTLSSTLTASPQTAGDSVYQDINASGTSTYTATIYVKSSNVNNFTLAMFWFTGGTTQSSFLNMNPLTGALITNTGSSYSITASENGFYKLVVTGTGTDAANTKVRYQLYINATGSVNVYGAQLEQRSFGTTILETTTTPRTTISSTWNNISYSGFNFTLTNSTYYSYVASPSAIRFTRTMPPTAKTGGYATSTATGDMVAYNYLQNDHTLEVWFKVNDRDPTNADATETFSFLCAFVGYHSGWLYTSTSYIYNIWGETLGPVYDVAGFSFADTTEGVWTHLVAVRKEFDMYLYKNGELKTKGRISAGFLNTQPTYFITNSLNVGAAATASYAGYSDVDISILRMYKRALTSDEVLQNFNANKSRFGL